MARPANQWIPAQLAPKDGKMEPPTSSDNEPVTCLGGCGRRLHSAKARARGYGERCWRKLHRRRTPRPRRAAPAAEAGEGQTELSLYDHQPTLWSL